MDDQHSTSTARPLLQKSSSDDDDEDYLSQRATGSSGSSAVTRRLTNDATADSLDVEVMRPDERHRSALLEAGRYNSHDDDDDDGDNDEFAPANLAKQLLRAENAPRDRFGFNYIVFYLLGITTLLPWNFFITADDYWMYKFRDVTNSTADGTLTPIQAGFTADLSVAAAVPSTVFLVLNAFIGHLIPLRVRMLGSMVVVHAFFLLTTVLVRIDTDAWQSQFFDLTIGSVVVMNVATAILSGGLFGISGQFPSEYVTAVVSGQALGGIFAALAEIVSLTFGASATRSAFVYFQIGDVVLALSIVGYVLAARTAFFRYYTVERLALMKAAAAATTTVAPCAEPRFGEVLGKIWVYGLAEWLVFAVTLCVYPSVTVLVRSQNHGQGQMWDDVYFVPVVNYLLFNSGDYLGRIMAGMIEWPRNKPRLLVALAALRIAFVPALIVCNASPRHNFPTLIHADFAFVALMAVFAFSNGYLANIALIGAPKSVTSTEREMASAQMAAFLGIGLAVGSTLSMVMVQII